MCGHLERIESVSTIRARALATDFETWPSHLPRRHGQQAWKFAEQKAASGKSDVAASVITDRRMIMRVVMSIFSYGFGAKWPGIQSHSEPLHFQ
ncbi:hypothetical protein PPH41_21275 [Burkholderia gladioli]|nr:hypothetical protein [Burkholderia gladioli]